MKKNNDSLLYKNVSLVMLLVALIFGAISYYSIWIVEPKINKVLEDLDKIVIDKNDSNAEKEKKYKLKDENFKKAYILLRDPQLFSRYERFENAGLRSYLIEIDSKIYNNIPLHNELPVSLYSMQNRRIRGSRLGRNTMVFFLMLSLVAFLFYLNEKRYLKK